MRTRRVNIPLPTVSFRFVLNGWASVVNIENLSERGLSRGVRLDQPRGARGLNALPKER